MCTTLVMRRETADLDTDVAVLPILPHLPFPVLLESFSDTNLVPTVRKSEILYIKVLIYTCFH